MRGLAFISLSLATFASAPCSAGEVAEQDPLTRVGSFLILGDLDSAFEVIPETKFRQHPQYPVVEEGESHVRRSLQYVFESCTFNAMAHDGKLSGLYGEVLVGWSCSDYYAVEAKITRLDDELFVTLEKFKPMARALEKRIRREADGPSEGNPTAVEVVMPPAEGRF